jgi:two-component system, chemotaxis family, chemotaxis protein CheY
MKKPLLLLVDDDRAVLEALEAELAPAFGDFCRIEAFEGPCEVPAALARWTEERRAIAVAIVDQKMPELSGVELLSALRAGAAGAGESAFHPAAATTAILLTGYAGLDSAIAAKNEAAVDRYLEKPWRAEALREAVGRLLARHLERSGADEHFLFREVVTEPEVLDFMRLRFEVYARTKGTEHLLPEEADARLDVDAYDSVSSFLGLFRSRRQDSRLVGTMRIVGAHPGPARPVAARVLAPYAALAERFEAPRGHALPMMEYLPDRAAVAAVLARSAAAGEQVVEPGRLALRPDFRADSGESQRHLARHMIEGTVAHCFHRGTEHALLTCIPPHDAFYRPYGFRVTEGTEVQFNPHLQAVVACLHGRIAWVPSPARERCTALAARIARTGASCRCASFPACLAAEGTAPAAYESGDFRGTDLLCPAKAAEALGMVTGGSPETPI